MQTSLALFRPPPPAAEGAGGDACARPFLKWVGGKSLLIDRYQSLLPARFGHYHEPFAGGAALFFSLRGSSPGPRGAVLSDINDELINCYAVVRDAAPALIAALQRHRYERDHYYAVRDQDPASLPPVERAARTIFLNRTGFNGLYRVNQDGRFNVPFGRFASPKICDAENLRACSAALRGARVEARDFAEVVATARAGDLVYLDPPYAPISSTSSFTAYVPGGFGWRDQIRLLGVFRELTRRKVHAMLSSSDVPAIREMYSGFSIVPVQAPRSINARSGSARKVGEVVIRNYE